MKLGDIITIGIRNSDILQGTANREAHRVPHTSCPVAIAINRQFGINTASAGRYTASFVTKTGEYIRFSLPKALKNFVYTFDMKRPVKPLAVRFKLRSTA